MTAQPRWPWPELEHALRCAGYRTRDEQIDALGITLRTLRRWTQLGVPDRTADQVALDIGSHPANIWTEWALVGEALTDHLDDDDPEGVSPPMGDTEAA